jgi:hypothetical protein
MTTLLIVLAFGSMLAVFWSVVAHVGTDPAVRSPRKTAIQLDPEA